MLNRVTKVVFNFVLFFNIHGLSGKIKKNKEREFISSKLIPWFVGNLRDQVYKFACFANSLMELFM